MSGEAPGVPSPGDDPASKDIRILQLQCVIDAKDRELHILRQQYATGQADEALTSQLQEEQERLRGEAARLRAENEALRAEANRRLSAASLTATHDGAASSTGALGSHATATGPTGHAPPTATGPAVAPQPPPQPAAQYPTNIDPGALVGKLRGLVTSLVAEALQQRQQQQQQQQQPQRGRPQEPLSPAAPSTATASLPGLHITLQQLPAVGSPSAGSNSNDSTTAFGVSGAVRTSGAPAVLYVNVDGTPMHVDPAVLEHVHDSRLYDMLVRQVHVLPRDDLGRPFLSYNPRVFQSLLSHLKERWVFGGAAPPYGQDWGATARTLGVSPAYLQQVALHFGLTDVAAALQGGSYSPLPATSPSVLPAAGPPADAGAKAPSAAAAPSTSANAQSHASHPTRLANPPASASTASTAAATHAPPPPGTSPGIAAAAAAAAPPSLPSPSRPSPAAATAAALIHSRNHAPPPDPHMPSAPHGSPATPVAPHHQPAHARSPRASHGTEVGLFLAPSGPRADSTSSVTSVTPLLPQGQVSSGNATPASAPAPASASAASPNLPLPPPPSPPPAPSFGATTGQPHDPATAAAAVPANAISQGAPACVAQGGAGSSPPLSGSPFRIPPPASSSVAPHASTLPAAALQAATPPAAALQAAPGAAQLRELASSPLQMTQVPDVDGAGSTGAGAGASGAGHQGPGLLRGGPGAEGAGVVGGAAEVAEQGAQGGLGAGGQGGQLAADGADEMAAAAARYKVPNLYAVLAEKRQAELQDEATGVQQQAQQHREWLNSVGDGA